MSERRRNFRHMAMTKVRVNLGAVVRAVRADRKTVVILEKDGLPVAALLDIDELEDLLDLHDPQLRAQIRQSMRDHRAGRSRPIDEVLAELEAEAR